MKWGHAYEVEGSRRLLYWVLTWVVAQSEPLDRWLTLILKPDGGMGGDPGWEIDHLLASDGADSYRVWADPAMSGIEPSEMVFDAQEVRSALKETLLAFEREFPEKAHEVTDVISRFRLWASSSNAIRAIGGGCSMEIDFGAPRFAAGNGVRKSIRGK